MQINLWLNQFFTAIPRYARIAKESQKTLVIYGKVLKLMDFPEENRAVYERNPLVEVVCQFSFPRLLELDESVPADFQKSLGKSFPSVGSRETTTFQVGGADRNSSPVLRKVVYDFSTRDGTCTVSLCSDFLAIKTEQYERWETLHGHIRQALIALRNSYDIPFFTRIGLRYVNVIKRGELGLDDTPWTDLIRESALGLLGDNEISGEKIVEQNSVTLLSLSRGKVVIRNGINITQDASTKNYVIDSDFFFDEQTESDHDAYELLAYYNGAARNAFRWFIKQKLHDALEPTDG